MGNSAISSGIITPRISYQRTFINADLATGVLTVTHNLNSNYVIVAVYDNNSKQIGPDDITLTSVNALTIDLTSYGTLTGTWSCIVIEQGATTSVVPTTIQDSTGNNQIVAGADNTIKMKTNSVQRLVLDNGGDIYTVAWTDYFSTSTKVGWSSPSGSIFYKLIGKILFVSYEIDGTSNDTVTHFTLPYSRPADSNMYMDFSCTFKNAGSYSATPGMVEIANSSNVVNFYTSFAGGAWTGSSEKLVRGQFWIEIA